MKDISLTEVYRAAGMFCTGTTGELASVTRVDGRPVGPVEVPGPLTAELSKLYLKQEADGQQRRAGRLRPAPSGCGAVLLAGLVDAVGEAV